MNLLTVVQPSTNQSIVLVTSLAPLMTLASTSSTIILRPPMLKESRMQQARMISKRLAWQFCTEQPPSTPRRVCRVCIRTWCRTFPSLLPQVSPQEKVQLNSSTASSFTSLWKVMVLLTEKGMEGNFRS